MKYVYFCVFLFFVSNQLFGINFLVNNCYIQKDRYSEWLCFFENDSICEFTHSFKCEDLANEYRIHKFRCNYSLIEKDELYIINFHTKDTFNHTEYYLDLPYLNSKSCFFLDSANREPMNSIPPQTSNYEKYGRIINMSSGSLYIHRNRKNRLIYYKKISEREGQGIVFKRCRCAKQFSRLVRVR